MIRLPPEDSPVEGDLSHSNNVVVVAVESVSTAVRGALSSLPGQQYLTIPALPTFRQPAPSPAPAPETASSDTEEEEEEEEDISLAFLRSKCDRLTERRATDFSQVDNIS